MAPDPKDPPLTDNVVLMPAQIVVVPEIAVGAEDNVELTVTVKLEMAMHPFEPVAVNVFVVVPELNVEPDAKPLVCVTAADTVVVIVVL